MLAKIMDMLFLISGWKDFCSFPNKELCKDWLKKNHPELDPKSEEGKKAMIQKIWDEMNTYRKGGKHEGVFPEKWLPTTLVICPEPWTEQNGLVNSTVKIVRGKVEKAYADRIEYAYTAEGRNIFNEKNLESI